jgi:hypothetical protein
MRVEPITGMRLLQPGDSLRTEEHLALQGIDVLFVSPTVHNMHVDRSLVRLSGNFVTSCVPANVWLRGLIVVACRHVPLRFRWLGGPVQQEFVIKPPVGG